MGRPIVLQVGPLAAASATTVSLSQKAAGAQNLVVNGASAAGTFSANNVCQSQSPAGSGALTLNGSAVNPNTNPVAAIFPVASRVYITSAGNDSGRTFTVTGTINSGNWGPVSVVETVTGANASVVSTTKLFRTVSSVVISGASASTVTVGNSGLATLDVGRRIIITSGGNDTGVTFTLSGTDWYGDPISEAITGVSGGAASSVLSYKTVTSIATSGAVATTVTVGTNTVADSPWARFDDFGAMAPVSIQCDVNGGTPSTGATVSQTLDDPNLVTNNDPPNTFQWTPATLVWINHPDSNLVAFTTSVQGNYGYPPTFARVTLTTTNSAYILATFKQAYQG